MVERRNIFMFSGQGSQYYHMGACLFQLKEFKQTIHALDQIAKDQLGESVIEHIYNPKYSLRDTFDHTYLSHPAIFMIEIAIANTLISMGIKPDMVLGYSMGTFAASVIADCLTAEDALIAVIEQAKCLEQYCPDGGMVALLENVQLFQDIPELQQYSELAAINFYSHFVIAASNHELIALNPVLKAFNIQRLPVSQAFHSYWIDGAKEYYIEYLKSLSFKTPKLPIICCISSEIETNYSIDKLWFAARETILFKKTIQNLELKGHYNYIDCGPSSTLATFLKYLLSNKSISRSFSIITPYTKEISNIENLQMNLSII